MLKQPTILECCDELEKSLKSNMNKEDLLKNCAREKMLTLYNNDNAEFDMLLDRLEKAVDYSSETEVKRCVTKLLRLLNSNRKTLIKSLRRIY